MEADKAKTKENVGLQEDLNKVIKHHVWGAMGVGLVPIPMVDMIALTAIQINLVRKIANAYGITFLKDKVKNILGALIGSAIPSGLGPGLAASITKAIPVIGQTVGAITMPVIAGASTYAIGKVFMQHFASGGTLMTFDPEKVKAYYAELFEKGKEVAKEGEDVASEM